MKWRRHAVPANLSEVRQNFLSDKIVISVSHSEPSIIIDPA
jgi:hypothetical protein